MKHRLDRFPLLLLGLLCLLAPARTFALAFGGGVTTWPGGNVYYMFSTSGTNAVAPNQQRAFLDAAGEWATFVNVHFIPWTTQANYVTVQVLTGLEGGQSSVGMVGGQQFLSVSPNAWNRGTLCHEIGHLLGLVHEHQRSDRGSYVNILSNNIESGGAGNFTIITNSQNETAYDFLSIMHYARDYLSTATNLDTIEPLPAYTNFINLMGEPKAVTLSDNDRAGVAAVYGAAPTNSPVVTNTLDSGLGSLRAALYYAYDHSGTHITFNIPTNDAGFSNGVFNIVLSDQLPWLVNSTLLDASSQPTNSHSNTNGPVIYLNGSLTPGLDPNANGLYFAGSNCTVRGLVINGFPESGVLFTGTNCFSNALSGCYVCTDPTGNIAVSNYLPGVTVSQGAFNNLIGGTNAAARNVISGSGIQGMVIKDAGTTGNVVEGNYIGLNGAGTAALPNTWAGIEIYNGASANTIGGTNAAARNIISGNGTQGVFIHDPGCNDNIIEGNYIGLNPSGTAAIPNSDAGIEITTNAQYNLVGGTESGAGNVISGNGVQGINISQPGTSWNMVQGNYIGLNAAGAAAVGNQEAGVGIYSGATSNIVGGATAAARNVISGNNQQGVAIGNPGTSGNVVEGNYLGLNAAGTAAVSNAFAGANIFDGATGNTIGGAAPGAGNVSSGNGIQGVFIQDSGTSGNYVLGNIIGLNPAGTAAIPNQTDGIEIYSFASGNFIGGTMAGAGNIVSGNGYDGVEIDFSAFGNTVQGNYLGLNAAGSAAIPNARDGIELYSFVSGALIGGTAPGAGNVISGNVNDGVEVTYNSFSNTVQGNLVGLNAAGTAPVPNSVCGVEILNSAYANLVGGFAGRNFISGNLNTGVLIDNAAVSNVVQGNTIGLNISNNAAVPNQVDGVELFVTAQSNLIGGTALGDANLIAGNTGYGIALYDADTIGNTLRVNSIYGNGSGGIYLYLANSNSIESAPTISSTTVTTNTVVIGSLSSLSNASFILDFYASPPPSSAKATAWLGAKTISTSASGNATFTNTLAACVPIGYVITATATDASGNTTILSSAVNVSGTSTVNDSIPNAWRALWFGGSGATTNSQSCATCDPDHDGMDNYAEFICGTDPLNAASVFKLSAPTVSGGIALVNLPSVPGITYRVEARDTATPGNWTILADQILGTGTNIQIPDTNALDSTTRFYRAAVEP